MTLSRWLQTKRRKNKRLFTSVGRVLARRRALPCVHACTTAAICEQRPYGVAHCRVDQKKEDHKGNGVALCAARLFLPAK